MEEIDTTVPKNNTEEEDEKDNEENLVIKSVSQNTICHRVRYRYNKKGLF